jgi:hypothetical protein
MRSKVLIGLSELLSSKAGAVQYCLARTVGGEFEWSFSKTSKLYLRSLPDNTRQNNIESKYIDRYSVVFYTLSHI